MKITILTVLLSISSTSIFYSSRVYGQANLGAQVNDLQSSTLQSPMLNGDLNSASTSFAAVVSNSKTQVSLQLGKIFNSGSIGTFTFSSPVNRGDQSVNFSDLNGLTNKTSAKISYQIGGPTDVKTQSTPEAFNMKLKLCERFARESSKPFDMQAIDVDEVCNVDFFDGNRIYQRLFFDTVLVPDSYKYNYYGIEGSAGHERFSYVTLDDLTQSQSESHIDYTMKLYGGRFINPWTFVSAAVSYHENHSGNPNKQICVPIGTAGGLSCSDLAVGAPKISERTVASLTFGALGDSFAYQFNVAHDIDNDITGVSVPIWFITDQTQLFSGGLQLNWDTDSEEFNASLFANIPFSIK